MRWAISAIVLAAVALLASGWRYPGPAARRSRRWRPAPPAASSTACPAWPARRSPSTTSRVTNTAARVRANLTTYFVFVDLAAIAGVRLARPDRLGYRRARPCSLRRPSCWAASLGERLFPLASETLLSPPGARPSGRRGDRLLDPVSGADMKIWDNHRGQGGAASGIGGSIGALLGVGAAAGGRRQRIPACAQIGFTIGVIALGAKMARVDGEVSDMRGRGLPLLLPGAAGRGEERPALLRSRQARRRRLRDLCAPGRGAVPRRAGNPRERARGPVQHRQGRRLGRRRGGRLSRQGRAHLRPRQRPLRARQGRGARASSSASPASSWASIRWRPTSRSARPGCARCAPTIPTG